VIIISAKICARGDTGDAPQLATRMLRSHPRVSNRHTVSIDVMIVAIAALVGGQVNDIVPHARSSRPTWLSGILTRPHSAVAMVLVERERRLTHLPRRWWPICAAYAGCASDGPARATGRTREAASACLWRDHTEWCTRAPSTS